MRLIRTFLIAAIGIASSVAFGQGVPSAPYLTLAQRSTFLAMNTNVRSTLGLTAAQDAKVTAAIDARGKTQTKLLAQQNPIESDIRKLEVKYSNEVLAVLTPVQEKKLISQAIKQIGAQALADPGIQKQLGITKPQSAKLAAALQKVKNRRLAFDEMVAKGLMDAKDDAERRQLLKGYDVERKRMEIDAKDLELKVVALLTPAQKSKWTALQA